jgi:hypothetical protein
VLFRIAPGHSAHRSGRGTHWGGSWTYEASQPPWVEAELTPEQQEVLSAPRGSLASMLPPTREGTRISGGAASGLTIRRTAREVGPSAALRLRGGVVPRLGSAAIGSVDTWPRSIKQRTEDIYFV